MKKIAVIMAGGKGERFWPKSKSEMPKQFLKLVANDKTMIQQTVERVQQLIDIENIFVVTNENYRQIVIQQLPHLPQENILVEWVSRNTAPCIGLAALHIQKRYKDAIMVVLPADHMIKNTQIFIDTLKEAMHIAEVGEKMVTIGIVPTAPETQYGYLHLKSKEYIDNIGVYKVRQFVEKPSLKVAKEYVETGEYLWNSGMFVWKVSTIVKQIKTLLPKLYHSLELIMYTQNNDEKRKIFEEVEPQSIDYGIMEKVNDIYTLPGSFGWDDVGNWLSLERLGKQDKDENVVNGNVIVLDSKNTIIDTGDKLVATIGVQDLIIINTNDTVLVSGKNSINNIKKLMEKIKDSNQEKYL